MKKQSKPRVAQMKLFQAPQEVPELPREVRQKMMRLLARMLRGHATRVLASSGKEAGNE
jgi:hypothetical protein